MTATSTKIKTIVIIDDDPDEFEIFQSALNEVAPSVMLHHVHNFYKDPGYERCLDTDLIILDVNMPGINGFDWLRNLRASRYSNLPVVVYSTSGVPNMVKKAYELGADLYCVKSSTLHQLKNDIAIILAHDWSNRKQIKTKYIQNGILVPLFS